MFTWWDEQGGGNCWQDNEGSPTDLRSDPPTLPGCPIGSLNQPAATHKTARLVPCAAWDRNDDFLDRPPGCDWFDTPPEPR